MCAELPAPIPVIVHLSGTRRGTTQRLSGDHLRIGTGADVDVQVAEEPAVGLHHASLTRRGPSYELETVAEHPVWVNGKLARRQPLDSGDLLEIGRDGPVLRFRLYPAGSRAYKSAAEAFADGVECARRSARSPAGRAAALLTAPPRELATQTSRLFRIGTVLAIGGLVVLLAMLARAYTRLEDRLRTEEMRLRGITELLEQSEGQISSEDLESFRVELETALARVSALEQRRDAPARVVAASSRSVVFLQGSFGFVEPESGQPLRYAGLQPDGTPLRSREGVPRVGLGGEGPLVESNFTGSAFVATASGLLLTNRHVATPWVYDPAAQMIASQGLQPVMLRFRGFLPAIADPLAVDLVALSAHADLAVLAFERVPRELSPLELEPEIPSTGEELLVLGYPTGIRALLARADEAFVERLSERGTMDFWALAEELAAAGHIAPLASRGIVAQLTPAAVVYDAETSRGGSGGPVLNLEGRVLAVSSAVVPEFGGSNLGVPALQARTLLIEATLMRLPPIRYR